MLPGIRFLRWMACSTAACAVLALGACDDQETELDDGDTDAATDAAFSSTSSGEPQTDGALAEAGTNDAEAPEDGSTTEPDADAGSLSVAAKIVVGGTFACVLEPSGTVLCWGDNDQRALGNGSDANTPRFYPEPAAVVGPGGVGVLDQIVDVSAGRAHACAVRRDGAVFCWGTSVWGELGDGVQVKTSSVPVQVQRVDGGALTQASAVFAGHDVSCAIVGPQRVAYCWGWNGFGQLGIGSPGGATPGAGVPGDDGMVPGLSTTARPMLSFDGANQMSNVRAIGIGFGYSCVSSNTIWRGYAEDIGSGAVWCVGQHNAEVQLGDGLPAGSFGPSRRIGYPVAVRTPRGDAWLSDIDDLSAGYSHTCALWNNHVTCWGGGGAGRGNGAGDPFGIEPPSGWSFLRANVTPLPGQLLATGTAGERDIARGKLSLSNAATCVRVDVVDNEEPATVVATHAVRCMGGDSQGALGDGAPGEIRGSFGKVVAPEWSPANGNVFLDGVLDMASGGGSQTCALRDDGKVFCWGSSNGGLMGPHDVGPVDYALPTPVVRADGALFDAFD